jgi:hypothetical protein
MFTDPDLTGDFNFDGRADAADYSVWRNGLNTTYTRTQYQLWKGNFGSSRGTTALDVTVARITIPESTSLASASIAAVFAAASGRRIPHRSRTSTHDSSPHSTV